MHARQKYESTRHIHYVKRLVARAPGSIANALTDTDIAYWAGFFAACLTFRPDKPVDDEFMMQMLEIAVTNRDNTYGTSFTDVK